MQATILSKKLRKETQANTSPTSKKSTQKANSKNQDILTKNQATPSKKSNLPNHLGLPHTPITQIPYFDKKKLQLNTMPLESGHWALKLIKKIAPKFFPCIVIIWCKPRPHHEFQNLFANIPLLNYNSDCTHHLWTTEETHSKLIVDWQPHPKPLPPLNLQSITPIPDEYTSPPPPPPILILEAKL